MSDLIETTATQESPFDALRLTREDGTEYWSARDLMPVLGYAKWQNFGAAIARAQKAARNVWGNAFIEHFTGVSKTFPSGNGAAKQGMDFHLTRYGAYLVTMNGDPDKTEIAAAQHYFAMRTREAEVGPKAIAYETLAPSQLRSMAHACRIKASALDELATLLLKIKESDQKYTDALNGEVSLEFRPEMGTSAGKMSRTELAVRYLVPDNLRKSDDGLYWITSHVDISKDAWGIPPYMATKEGHAEARNVLVSLGWESFRVQGQPGSIWYRKLV